MRKPARVYVLAGPTAVGKTAVAQWIAERTEALIISADSMLVYRGMDVGTAKPSLAERGCVPYAGIDLVDPSQPFSVWHYREAVLPVIRDAAAANRRIVLVGGSGLYIKSLLNGLMPLPGPDAALRRRWEPVLRDRGAAPLRAALAREAPALLAALDDPDNGRRLLRALELAAAGVREPTRANLATSAPIPALAMPADRLNARIAERTAAMFAAGLDREVTALLARNTPLSRTARQAIGYAETIAWLEGRCAKETAIAETERRTRQLAKRQRTWFRHQADVRWIEVEHPMDVSKAAEDVEAHWARFGPVALAED